MVYTIVDIETTGLSPNRHKITEIAAVKIDENCNILDEFQSLINPGCKIPSFITRLTGITDEMVVNQPKIDEIMPRFLEFMKNDIIIAHNASFDYGFLRTNAENYGFKLLNNKLCTRKLANRILFDSLSSKRLNCLCEYYGIENDQAHRAMSDVKATLEVFKNFKDTLRQQNILTTEEILQFERKPRRKLDG